MKKVLFVFGALLYVSGASALPLTGFYQTIDDKTNQPKAIVALYEYPDDNETELAGRIVATYDANGNVVTDSKFVGMDIIWDMEWDAKDNQYEDGRIKDPQSGKVYKSVIWQDTPDILNVRGKIGPLGRTQHWKPLSGDAVPDAVKNIDTTNWKPTVQK